MITYKKLIDNVLYGIVGSTNSGKSNTLLYLIEIFKKEREKNDKNYNIICSFNHSFYRSMVKGVKHIFTLKDLELCYNSVIFIDEFHELFKLHNPREVVKVKKILNNIFHQNNIIFLCSTPNFFNQFLSSKIDKFFIHKIDYDEIVNGSQLKKFINELSGDFVGVYNFKLNKGECFFNNEILKIPYKKKYDKKKDYKKIW